MIRRSYVALFIIILLLIAPNLVYITNWNLLLSALYWILPSEIGDEIGLTAVVFIQTWTFAVGITVITATDSQLMDRACKDVGCPAAWILSVLIHYLPPILLTRYIHSTPHPLLRDPTRLLAAWISTVTVFVTYGIYMDPESKYNIPTSPRTFVSWMLTFAALFLLLLQRVVGHFSA